MSSPLNPKAPKPGKRRKATVNEKRAEGQDRRVREILNAAVEDGLVEVEINGVPVSLLKREVTDAVVERVLKDIAEGK